MALGTVDHEAAKQLGIKSYLAEGVRYSLKQSNYGARLVTTRASKLFPARNLARNYGMSFVAVFLRKKLFSDDPAERQLMVDTLKSSQQRLQIVDEELAVAAENAKQYKAIENRLKAEKDRLTEQKNQIIQRSNAFRLKQTHYGNFG